MSRIWRHDLAWAGFILLVAAFFGLMQEWLLVRQSWRGELPARIEQMRTQRREQEFQGVKTIDLARAYALFQAGQALFIDARPTEEYAELHVSKALSLTPSLLEQGEAEKLAGAAKDREIVVYCGQESCDLSLRVAEKLQALGYTRVAVFMGGFRAWDEAGYPADTSK
ncbi:MAG: rhodanese-like domain-containing protein [Desulfobaccales bacterium]